MTLSSDYICFKLLTDKTLPTGPYLFSTSRGHTIYVALFWAKFLLILWLFNLHNQWVTLIDVTLFWAKVLLILWLSNLHNKWVTLIHVALFWAKVMLILWLSNLHNQWVTLIHVALLWAKLMSKVILEHRGLLDG